MGEFYCSVMVRSYFASYQVSDLAGIRASAGFGYAGEVPLGSGLDGVVSYDSNFPIGPNTAFVAFECAGQPDDRVIVKLSVTHDSEPAYRIQELADALLSFARGVADRRDCPAPDLRSGRNLREAEVDRLAARDAPCGPLDADVLRSRLPDGQWYVQSTEAGSFPVVGCRVLLAAEGQDEDRVLEPGGDDGTIRLSAYRGVMAEALPTEERVLGQTTPLPVIVDEGGYDPATGEAWARRDCLGDPVYYDITNVATGPVRPAIDPAAATALFSDWIRASAAQDGCPLP